MLVKRQKVLLPITCLFSSLGNSKEGFRVVLFLSVCMTGLHDFHH